MKQILIGLLIVTVMVPAFAADIPDRPEKLVDLRHGK